MQKGRQYNLGKQTLQSMSRVGLKATPDELQVVSQGNLDSGAIAPRGSLKKTYLKSFPNTKAVILIPESQLRDLGKLRHTLRHELSHYKLGHELTRADTPREDARKDIETVRYAEGKATAYDLGNLALRLVSNYGITRREAMLIVREEATKLGVSKSTSTRANKLLFTH